MFILSTENIGNTTIFTVFSQQNSSTNQGLSLSTSDTQHIYADDSNVHISAADNEELIVKATDDISFLKSWFSINDLVMNRKTP